MAVSFFFLPGVFADSWSGFKRAVEHASNARLWQRSLACVLSSFILAGTMTQEALGSAQEAKGPLQLAKGAKTLEPVQAPLEEPEATPDLENLLNVPEDPQSKVFASDVERDLKSQDLNTLLERLEAAADPTEAGLIADEVVLRFHKSGNETVDILMTRVVQSMRAKQTALALDLINTVILLEPDFAEGWNKRAHLHFMMGSMGKSISDLEKVLELQPRHFGALNGLAIILQRLGQKDHALQVYEELLKIHPFLENAHKSHGALSEELAGRGA